MTNFVMTGSFLSLSHVTDKVGGRFRASFSLVWSDWLGTSIELRLSRSSVAFFRRGFGGRGFLV